MIKLFLGSFFNHKTNLILLKDKNYWVMKKWKTVIMSDLHLGARQSQTDKILKFWKKTKWRL